MAALASRSRAGRYCGRCAAGRYDWQEFVVGRRVDAGTGRLGVPRYAKCESALETAQVFERRWSVGLRQRGWIGPGAMREA
jgi:hypothetical protein